MHNSSKTIVFFKVIIHIKRVKYISLLEPFKKKVTIFLYFVIMICNVIIEGVHTKKPI